jgi:microcystin-dependent protein
MSDPFLGEIRLFGFPRVPTGWLACNGQSLQISQYDALYTLLGTAFGGDGVSTFNVPDLQGRVAIGQGQGRTLPAYVLGEPGGEEGHTLIETEMPTHSHALMSSPATGDTATPGPTVHIATASAGNLYAPPSSIPSYGVMAACVTTAGSSLPHDNMMPSVVCNYCICIAGVFPSQG